MHDCATSERGAVQVVGNSWNIFGTACARLMKMNMIYNCTIWGGQSCGVTSIDAPGVLPACRRKLTMMRQELSMKLSQPITVLL